MILPDPPPSYTPTRSRPRSLPTLLGLPSHLLLQVLDSLSLPTLALSVRRTNKELYLFSMSILRERMWGLWKAKVGERGWTTDARGMRRGAAEVGPPVPPKKGSTRSSRSSTVTSLSSSPLPTIIHTSQETATYDLFIISLAYSFHLSSESELMSLPSTSESISHDLFDHLQPQSRIWDLFLSYARQDGLDAFVGMGDVGIVMTGKSVRVLLPFRSTSGKSEVLKGVVETKREEGASAESVADRLVRLVGEEVERGRLRRAQGGGYEKA